MGKKELGYTKSKMRACFRTYKMGLTSLDEVVDEVMSTIKNTNLFNFNNFLRGLIIGMFVGNLISYFIYGQSWLTFK